MNLRPDKKLMNMKKIFLIILVICFAMSSKAQNNQAKINSDSVTVGNRVEFYTYDGPYGEQEHLKKPAVKLILTVKNKGRKPLPDLCVTNRSKYVNMLINDSIQNPVSFYNGSEAPGAHLLQKNGSDTYTWWFFEDENPYSKAFTVQWRYIGLFSEKLKVTMAKRASEVVK